MGIKYRDGPRVINNVQVYCLAECKERVDIVRNMQSVSFGRGSVKIVSGVSQRLRRTIQAPGTNVNVEYGFLPVRVDS